MHRIVQHQAESGQEKKAPKGLDGSDHSVALAVVADPGQGLGAGLVLAVLVDEADGVDHLTVQVAVALAADEELLAPTEIGDCNRVTNVVDLTARLVCCSLGVLFEAEVLDHGSD